MLSSKRILWAFLSVSPLVVMLAFFSQPQIDKQPAVPLFHFYVVTFTSFSATVVALLLMNTLGPVARARHVLAATAFMVMGGLFLSHGLATSGALIDHFHPAIQWSAWMTLFGGGLLFAIAGLDGPQGLPRGLSARAITVVAILSVLVYSAIAATDPDLLTKITALTQPWHRYTIGVVTAILWLLAAVSLARLAAHSKQRIDWILVFIAVWMAQATLSLHVFTVWNLSWWMYHVILLSGFLITTGVLVFEYERARQFRLLPYYVGLSLILTVLLALAASALFTEMTQAAFFAETETAVGREVQAAVDVLARDAPAAATPDERAEWYGIRLSGHVTGTVMIYGADGVMLYPPPNFGETPEHIDADKAAQFFEMLEKHASHAEVHEPGEVTSESAYAPVHTSYFIEAFVPLPEKAGAVELARDLPNMSAALIRARASGLLIALFTMGGLFACLLTIVQRADGIMTARTNELAGAYLQLRAAEGMRDDLTAMMVHDLRSPLTAVAASLDLLKHFVTGAEQVERRRQFIDSARGGIRRMTALIDDILDVSKLEAGELRLQRTPTPLAPLLAERVESFAAQAVAETKTLTVVCAPTLSASVDAGLLGRVFDNLLSNAFKYTMAGGKIEVSALAGPGRILFRVQDNGEGVPDEYKPLVFGKFVQVPQDARSVRKGTGLGLAFCRMVVEAHGGEIALEDTPGGGSTVVFWVTE